MHIKAPMWLRKAPQDLQMVLQMANKRPQGASKRPRSEARESCAFLARRGGLAEHVPNREWWVVHWFDLVFFIDML